MNKFKILIVDDEANNLQILLQILKEDYQLGFAKNGTDALRCIQEQQPDLVLLDIMMPGMDGYEVCRRLKADPSTAQIPVIFVTALDEVEDEQQGFDLGAVDYINKPVRTAVVRARVHTHLSLYNQQRACEETVRQRTAELEQTRLEVIQHLGRAAEYKDNETGLHVIRMSYYSELIARALNWSEEDCKLLLNAAPMHDIGKIGIPDAILRKPGKLDDTEWTIMKQHPEIGANILKGDTPLQHMARDIALYHHEKWDGSGYPQGLAGTQITLAARIVAVADVFDALTTVRPYKAAWPVEKAVEFMQKQAGQHFDPDLVRLFLNALPAILEIKEKWKEALLAQ